VGAVDAVPSAPIASARPGSLLKTGPPTMMPIFRLQERFRMVAIAAAALSRLHRLLSVTPATAKA
jgi:hypothetical protein